MSPNYEIYSDLEGGSSIATNYEPASVDPTVSRRWPTVKTSVEFAGMGVVLIGLLKVIVTFRATGYLPTPFVFDVGDTFMDWFNTAYWAHNHGAYSVWSSIYFPLSFVITGLFGDPRCYASAPYDARDCDVIGSAFLILTYFGCVIATGIALRRQDRSTAFFRTVSIALGGPLLFALERGNLIMIAYIPFVLLYGGVIKSDKSIAIASAFLINMKVYLLLPVLALAIKRQWRTLELCGFAALALYLITIIIVDAGTPGQLAGNLNAWFNFRGSMWDGLVYSTTYNSYLRLDDLQFPVRDYIGSRWVDGAKIFIHYEILLSRGVAILCITGAWVFPRVVSLNRLIFFMLMQAFLGQNPGGYALILIVFLVFSERWKNAATAIAIVFCYLLSIPADINIATLVEVQGVSWLSGRLVNTLYALPLGSLLRPGLLLIILWSLAIDSLIELHRAAKTMPANFGLAFPRAAGRPYKSPPSAALE